MLKLLIIILIFSGSIYLTMKSIIIFISFIVNKEKENSYLLGFSIIPWCFFTYQIYIALVYKISNIIGAL